jgi:YegS/Rv2252/BmrU family lipid kinase
VSTAIIINPVSGGFRTGQARARAELAQQVADRARQPVEIFVTEAIGHARELAAAAVRRGVRLVVAWGGDGTINEVSSALAFGDVPLGIIPAGSGNGLARELGVDPRPDHALVDALGATPRSMDVGDVEGRLFVNLAGIGVDAFVASRFSLARRRGFLGYINITARALATYVPTTYRMTSPGATVTARALLVTIANSAQFGNGARIAPGARVDDGLLDLVIVEERWRVATIVQLPRLFTGTADRIRGCTTQRIREVTIEADDPMTYHLDGEPVVGGNRLTARVHPGALKIAVR